MSKNPVAVIVLAWSLLVVLPAAIMIVSRSSRLFDPAAPFGSTFLWFAVLGSAALLGYLMLAFHRVDKLNVFDEPHPDRRMLKVSTGVVFSWLFALVLLSAMTPSVSTTTEIAPVSEFVGPVAPAAVPSPAITRAEDCPPVDHRKNTNDLDVITSPVCAVKP